MTTKTAPVILPVRFEHQLAEELDAVREGRDISRNAFVIEAVKAALVAQPDLKFRVAELALRELLVFVGSAEEGGVMDQKTAKSVMGVLRQARAHISGKANSGERQKMVQGWSPLGSHGLALVATEPLREFVDRFRTLCYPADMDGGKKMSGSKKKAKKVRPREPK